MVFVEADLKPLSKSLILTHSAFLLSIAVLLHILITLGHLSEFTFPHPLRILIEFSNLPYNSIIPRGFFHHLTVSVNSIFVASLLLIGFVFPLSLVIALWRKLKIILEPVILSLFAIPPIIYFPIILLLVGFGVESKILMGAIVGAPPIFIYTINAVRVMKTEYIKLGLIYTKSFLKILFKIILPSIIPIVMTGIRFGVSYVFVGVIFAEMTAGGEGLGFLISWSTTTLRVPLIYANVMVVLLLSLLFYSATYFIEKRVATGR